MQWVITSKSLSGRILQFAIMLSPWELEVHRSVKGECGLTGLLTAAIVSSDVMDDVLEDIFPDKASAPRFVAPPILLPRTYEGLLLSTDGSAKPPEKGSDGSFGFVVWKLPEWDVDYAENVFQTLLTVNEAEYHGNLRGLTWLSDRGYKSAVVAGDSRIAPQQLIGSLNCHKSNLEILLL